MNKFKSGDLVETTTFEGETVYGVVIKSSKVFNFEELQVLLRSKLSAVIYDGRKGTVRLIQRFKDNYNDT